MTSTSIWILAYLVISAICVMETCSRIVKSIIKKLAPPKPPVVEDVAKASEVEENA